MTRVRALAGIAGLSLLAGCGGGGGGAVDSTGTPPPDTSTPIVSTPTPVTPTPTTTPAPAPITTNYNDAEYARSNGAGAASAISAYNAGATGAGVKIAVIDSGLATVGSEFTGRIDPASRDFGGNANYTDIDGHGTAVTAVAAAARNGANIEGVAFGATILALRADTAGTCAQTDGCGFSTATLATALDYARTNGAKVVNFSLGGATATSSLTAAVNRATAAGMIVVISAGNDATADPDPLAQVAASVAARGLVIIAGAHDSTGALSTFSAKAGSFSQYYLAALGTRVRSFDQTGTAFLYSGTSFAAPEIAGAVALIEQAFPNLTATQVVSLLYASATDAGATGVDTTYGHGLLNLVRAFSPIGATSLAGSAIAIGADDASLLSGPMGDAVLGGQSLGRAIILDSYGRAFGLDLTARAAHASATRPLYQAIGGDIRNSATRLAGLDVRTTLVAGDLSGEPWAGFAQRGRGASTAVAFRPIAGDAVARIDARTSFGFAWATGGRALDDRLAGDAAPGAFLAARGPAETPGFAAQRGTSVALRHDFGGVALTASAERGTLAFTLPGDVAKVGDVATPGYTLATIALEKRVGALRLRAGVGSLDEAQTLLGARLAPAFGRAGALTRFVDLDARLALGQGWQAGAAWRRGQTQALAGGLLAGGTLASSAAAFDVGRQSATSRFGLRFALPARITAGALRLAVPVSYDYGDGAIGYSETRLDLTPQGRERDIEASWGIALGHAWLDTNLFLRRQPGNIAAAPDDLGTAVRLSLGW